MSPLLKHFSRIVVISLRHREDRRNKLLTNLCDNNLATEDDITWFDAIDGSKETIPDWWKSGSGAWGCRFSQLRVIEQAQRDGLTNILIIEDDAVFHPRTAEWLDVTVPLLPNNWGQFYLGGQHQAPTIKTSHPKLVKARNINRTHAYAVNHIAYQRIIDQISSDEIYRQNPGWHVDHHFGHCQETGVWDAYAPTWWMAGQDEGQSNIAGASFERRWWQEGLHYWKLPFVHLAYPAENPASEHLYFPEKSPPDTHAKLALWLRRIAYIAWSKGRLPTYDVDALDPTLIGKLWPGGIRTVKTENELDALADYPANGLFPHPFALTRSTPI